MRGYFWLVWALFLSWMGCQEQTGAVTVSPGEIKLTIPAKLLSECGSKVDGVRLPVTITNTEPTARDLVADGTGCSCYGAWQGERRLKKGDRITVPAHGSTVLEIQGSSPKVPREVVYTATFHWEGGSSATPEAVRVTVTTQFKRDLEITEPILLDVEVKGLGKKTQRDLAVITHTRKSPTANTTIQFGSAPNWLKLVEVRKNRPSQEIEPGLWRQEWILSLEIVPPLDLTTDATITPWEVVLMGDSAPLATVREQMRLRLKTALQFPHKVSLGRLTIGQEKSRRVQILSLAHRPFSLALHPESSDQLQVELGSSAELGHQIKLTVVPSRTGAFDELLKLTSSDPEIPELSIKVTGFVDPPDSGADNQTVPATPSAEQAQ